MALQSWNHHYSMILRIARETLSLGCLINRNMVSNFFWE